MIKSERHEGKDVRAKAVFISDHRRLTDAGWAYRMNHGRGWVLYRDCKTGRWYTQKDALAILDEEEASRACN